MNILITRPKHQAAKLSALINKSGNTPLLFPALKITPLPAQAQFCQYDLVIFISKNAVDYGVETLQNLQYQQLFAIGSATAKRLIDNNLKVDDFPKKQASSEALLALKSINKLQGKSILIFRGKGGAQTLKQSLSKHNTVEYIEVYQRIQAPITAKHQQSLAQFLSKSSGAVIITSIDSLNAMLAIMADINPDSIQAIKRYPLLVLSSRIAAYAQSVGFSQVKIAPKTNNQGLLALI